MAQSSDAREAATDVQQYASSVQACNGSMAGGRQAVPNPLEDPQLRAERLRQFTEDNSGLNDRFLAIANASSNVGGATH